MHRLLSLWLQMCQWDEYILLSAVLLSYIFLLCDCTTNYLSFFLNGHLGCFHVGTIMDSAATTMIIDVHSFKLKYNAHIITVTIFKSAIQCFLVESLDCATSSLFSSRTFLSTSKTKHLILMRHGGIWDTTKSLSEEIW